MKSGLEDKKLTVWLIVIFAVAMVWDAWLWTFSRNDTVWHFLYNVVYAFVYFFSAVVCLQGYRRLEGRGRLARACRLWGYSMLLWAIGLLVWTGYNLFLGQEVPYPSLADVFFVAFYPLMGLGILHFRSYSTDEKSKYFSFANVPIAVAVAVIVLVFLRRPDLSADLPMLERAVNVAYSVGDAFLLSVALANLREIAGGFRPAYLWLLGSLVFLTAGDLLFSYRTALGSYWNGGISDVMFTIFPAVFTYGVIKMLRYWTTQKPGL
jgi:hypothetical protein